MKPFIFKVFVFLLFVVLFDRGLGLTLSYMTEHTSGGYIGHHNYILNKCKDDILIFGSSRAWHHYNAPMIQDSLGLSCYNCGQDGEGIVLFYGWWQYIKQRYNPKLILYEVMPGYDIERRDNTKHLGWLKGLYDNPAIKQEFDEIDILEKYKMQSLLYRYNSRFHQILIDYLHPIHNINRGFLPVHRDLDPLRVKKSIEGKGGDEVPVDSLKIQYFKNILNELNGTKFVFVESPTWYGTGGAFLDVVKDIAAQYHIEFIDFHNHPDYVHHNEYYSDGSHLNARGADQFTRDLIAEIKRRCILE